MASLSTYLANEILDQILGASAWASPATVYVALSTTTITAASTGATIAEPVGGSYARVAITNNLTNWPAASGGAKDNANAIEFPRATADWGTVTHVALLDSATVGAGNILVWVAIAGGGVAINTNDTFRFPAGDFDVTAS